MAEEEMITLDTLKMAAEIVKKRSGVKNLVRIPPRLYQAHPEAYTPLFVSIGPFHYIGRYSKLSQGRRIRFNDVNILAMETQKQACMLRFISERIRYHSPDHGGGSGEVVIDNASEQQFLERCQEFVRAKIDDIWDLYREEIEISLEILANIILVDSCFLLCFLIHGPKGIFSGLTGDLVLLENQIPFFVLVGLSKMLTKFHYDSSGAALGKLILDTFALCPKKWSYGSHFFRNPPSGWDCIHLLDFIREYHVSQITIKGTLPIQIDRWRAIHLRNATKLSASGVTIIRRAQGIYPDSVLMLSFSKGVLSIPPLLLSDYTEKLFINLLAHEHLSLNYEGYFTSYAFFMSQLIESKEDLQLLVKKGIIHNQLVGREDVSKLFSNITKQFVLRDFLYWDLCYEIEAYVDSTWQRHIQVLKERYFSNPWTTLSVFAATILLLLTFMQTFYTALTYYQGVHPK